MRYYRLTKNGEFIGEGVRRDLLKHISALHYAKLHRIGSDPSGYRLEEAKPDLNRLFSEYDQYEPLTVAGLRGYIQKRQEKYGLTVGELAIVLDVEYHLIWRVMQDDTDNFQFEVLLRCLKGLEALNSTDSIEEQSARLIEFWRTHQVTLKQFMTPTERKSFEVFLSRGGNPPTLKRLNDWCRLVDVNPRCIIGIKPELYEVI